MAQHIIIVGVDGSKVAQDAVRWAVGVMRDGDILRIITVAAETGATARLDALILDPMREAAYNAGATPDRVFSHIVPKKGNTGVHLVACAGQSNVKLIVLGSRGLGAFKQAMMSLLGMGSVSSYVLEHSRVPTVIVRNGTALDAVLKPQPDIQEPHRMCVALDGSSSAVCALDWALANLVNLDKDELNLITAVVKPAHEQPQDLEFPDGPPIPIIGYVSETDEASKLAAEIVKQASGKAVQAGMPDSRITTAVLDLVNEGGDSLVGTIVRYCSANKVYTLCMGHRAGHCIGSTARKVLEDAPCPVVIVRAE